MRRKINNTVESNLLIKQCNVECVKNMPIWKSLQLMCKQNMQKNLLLMNEIKKKWNSIDQKIEQHKFEES